MINLLEGAINKQGKDKLTLKHHAIMLDSLEKARDSCETLSLMLEYHKPDLSLSYANLLEELVAMLDYLAELKRGL